MKKLFLFSILILLSCRMVLAQSLSYGILAGANTNLVLLASKYEISTDFMLKPKLAYFGGGFITINRERNSLMTSLEYTRISNSGAMSYTDIQGSDLGKFKTSFINIYLTANFVWLYEIRNHITIGSGVSANYLIDSKLKLPKNETIYISGIPSNPDYENLTSRKWFLAVPVIASYQHGNFTYFFKGNIGITNRLIAKSMVKEYNNTLNIGLGYRLKGD